MKNSTAYNWASAIIGFAVGIMFCIVVQEARAEEVCYEAYSTPVVVEYRITNLMITAYMFDTVEELAADVGEDVAAWSECETIVEQNIAWCEIWMVIPTNVLGDPHMDGLGHETLHGLIGDFHPEDNLE